MPGSLNIALTGSTGQLGSYLLATLLATPAVSRIWCLNRTADARDRQLSGLRSRGLYAAAEAMEKYELDEQRQQHELTHKQQSWGSAVSPFCKVEFLQVDLASPTLGIPSEAYAIIRASVTHILHCAWPVDWNQAFSSFQPAEQGVANLISLAAAAGHDVPNSSNTTRVDTLHAKPTETENAQTPLIFFISSVAAVGNWNAIPGARSSIPEAAVEDWKVARFGYGQS